MRRNVPRALPATLALLLILGFSAVFAAFALGGDEAGEPDEARPLVTAEDAAALADCAAVVAAYEELMTVHRSCREDADCHVVLGHCAQGLGGCWYAVEQRVSADDAERLAGRHRELGCGGGVCRCARPPDAAACRDGLCVGAAD